MIKRIFKHKIYQKCWIEKFVEIFIQLHYMKQSGKGVLTIILKYDTSVYSFGSSFIQCAFKIYY